MAMMSNFEVATVTTRATEVGQLIGIAMDCGLAKNPDLFDHIVKIVYGDKDEAAQMMGMYMSSIAEAIKAGRED